MVFMYHKFGISKYPSTNITLEQFKSHLEELSKPKYNVKSIDYIIDTIINDTNRDNFMAAEDALKYGLIDQIVKTR